jgi:hypothetical protein
VRIPFSIPVFDYQSAIQDLRAVVKVGADVNKHEILKTKGSIAVGRRAVRAEVPSGEDSAYSFRPLRGWRGALLLRADALCHILQELFVFLPRLSATIWSNAGVLKRLRIFVDEGATQISRGPFRRIVAGRKAVCGERNWWLRTGVKRCDEGRANK